MCSFFFRWARPTSIFEFSVRGCVGTWVRVRKLVEIELTMTMKRKGVNFYTVGTQVGTSRTQNGPVDTKLELSF